MFFLKRRRRFLKVRYRSPWSRGRTTRRVPLTCSTTFWTRRSENDVLKPERTTPKANGFKHVTGSQYVRKGFDGDTLVIRHFVRQLTCSAGIDPMRLHKDLTAGAAIAIFLPLVSFFSIRYQRDDDDDVHNEQWEVLRK